MILADMLYWPILLPAAHMFGRWRRLLLAFTILYRLTGHYSTQDACSKHPLCAVHSWVDGFLTCPFCMQGGARATLQFRQSSRARSASNGCCPGKPGLILCRIHISHAKCLSADPHSSHTMIHTLSSVLLSSRHSETASRSHRQLNFPATLLGTVLSSAAH
jgi:hypothetical protein